MISGYIPCGVPGAIATNCSGERKAAVKKRVTSVLENRGSREKRNTGVTDLDLDQMVARVAYLERALHLAQTSRSQPV